MANGTALPDCSGVALGVGDRCRRSMAAGAGIRFRLPLRDRTSRFLDVPQLRHDGQLLRVVDMTAVAVGPYAGVTDMVP